MAGESLCGEPLSGESRSGEPLSGEANSGEPREESEAGEDIAPSHASRRRSAESGAASVFGGADGSAAVVSPSVAGPATGEGGGTAAQGLCQLASPDSVDSDLLESDSLRMTLRRAWERAAVAVANTGGEPSLLDPSERGSGGV